jgi:hypothetical protein
VTGTGDYWQAVLELAAMAGAVGFGAFRVRAALLPGWRGAPGRLVESILGIALLLAVAQVLGAVHAFEEAPFVAGCVLVGLGAALGAGAIRAGADGTPEAIRPSSIAVTVAVLVAGLLAVNWAIGAEESLHRGMYGFDTMWYHGPFAAGFAESGSTTAIHFTGAYGPLVWFYPQSSELLHAGGILLFGNDFLSPLLNLGWLGLALLAAWCVGRPFGAGPLTLVAAALVLGSQPWLASQPGEGYNDIAAFTLLLAAVAVIVNGCTPARAPAAGRLDLRLDPSVLVIAGLAAGLAMSVKLTAAAPVAALTVGLIALSPKGGRRRTAMAGIVPMLALGSYWYLRNLVLVGNPLPSLDLGVFPAPELPPHRSDFSVAHYLADGHVWRGYFLPGLHEAFGAGWPVLVAAATLGALLAAWRGPSRVVRLLGGVAVVAALAYLVTPYSAQGPEGMPRNFEGNLRYAAPAIFLGIAALACLPQLAGRRARLGAMAGLVALFIVSQSALDARHGPYLPAALGIALVMAVPVVLWLVRGRVAPPVLVAGLGMVAAGVLATGEHQHRVYIESRYASPSGITQNRPLEAAFAWARDVHGAKIATDAFRQYGLYGNDLSNRVTFIGHEGLHGSFESIGTCREWRRALNEGAYDYVIPAPSYRDAAGRARAAPAFGWTRDDRAARKVRDAGPVFAVRGSFSPGACRAG